MQGGYIHINLDSLNPKDKLGEFLGKNSRAPNPTMSRLSTKVGKNNLHSVYTMNNIPIEVGEINLLSVKVLPPRLTPKKKVKRLLE